MSLKMPEPDASVIARRAGIAASLRAIVPGEGVIDHPDALRPYESDGLSAYRQPPLVVVLPETTAQVAAVLAWCDREGVKVVPRGSGTSLSGGALPLADAVLLGLARLNRVLEIDYDERIAIVQPGVTNLAVTRAVEERGFYYAPDPSSQIACSIGGNVAENAGGVHCLKYGVTTNNVLGVEFVTMAGEILRIGGRTLDPAGLDLLGVIVGSEGLLGVVTEVTVRILPAPETARALLIGFPDVEGAGRCVADVIAAGIIPAGMEMMDRPAIHAAEAFVRVGYPLDVDALLIVELDGPAAECSHLIDEVAAIARANGAASLRISQDEDERIAFWAGRKGGVSGDGPARARFLLHGRHHPPPPPARGAGADGGAVGGARPRRRQRLPRRRRQPPSADPLRRQQPGRTRARRGVRRRHPAPVRRGRRGADRRARRRRREARPDCRRCSRRSISLTSSGSSARSIRSCCSIPARCSRRYIAAPNSAASTSMAGRLPFPDLPRF